LRRPVFAQRLSGVPPDITMYRLETRREFAAIDVADEGPSQE
jgi:hypothetical protein